jgi:hypothetical protein
MSSERMKIKLGGLGWPSLGLSAHNAAQVRANKEIREALALMVAHYDPSHGGLSTKANS